MTTEWTSGLLAAALKFAGSGFDQRVLWRAGGWQCELVPDGFVLSGTEGSLRYVVPGVDLAALSDLVAGDEPPAVVTPVGPPAEPADLSAPDGVGNGPEPESGFECEQPEPAADLPAVSGPRRRLLSAGEDLQGWRPLFPSLLH